MYNGNVSSVSKIKDGAQANKKLKYVAPSIVSYDSNLLLRQLGPALATEPSQRRSFDDELLGVDK